MSKFKTILRKSYIYIILALTYIPLCYAAIWSFNKEDEKGRVLKSWGGFTNDAWSKFWEEGRDTALLNSLIIAFITSILVVTISLITVYAIWRQRNKNYERIVKGVTNIPLINPDNITAIGLVLVFSSFFGILANTKEGLARGIVAHAVMALPYGITLMIPRSEKFNASLLEASQDLGYNKVASWFKTYFVFMIPSIIFAAFVSIFLSFDDFIILRTVSNTSTLGTKLYGGEFRAWGLVVGASLLFLTIIGNIAYVSYKAIMLKKAKKGEK